MPYTEFIKETDNVIKVRVVKTMASGNVHIYLAGEEEDDKRYTELDMGPNIVDLETSEF